MKKMFLLHNEMSPYRLPIFEELTNYYDLTVCFLKVKSNFRLWDINNDSYTFKYKVCKNIKTKINLINSLLRNEYDIYLIGEVSWKNYIYLILILLIARFKGKPLVYWTGFVETPYYNENNFFKKKIGDQLRKYLGKYSSACISYSNMTKEYLMNLGVDPNKIFSGTQIINKKYSEVINYDKNKRENIILYLGYFQERKGIHLLIEIFNEMDIDNTKLIIAGSGKYEKHLKKISNSNPNIIFPGYVKGKEKARYYSKADIFILPTLHDPWGLVLNEAMYFGLPIITTEYAGGKEMIKNNGFIVDFKEKEKVKKIITKLLQNEKLRKKMGKNSIEIIKKYNIDMVIDVFNESIKYSMTNM